MNRRAVIFLGVAGATPIAIILLAVALLASAAIGRDFVWRQTESDLGTAIANANPLAIKLFAPGSANIDTPVFYSHPRILAGRPMQLPPIAIALVHNHTDIVRQFLDAGSDPATAIGKLPLETASALLAYAIARRATLAVTYLVKHRVDPHRGLTVDLRTGRIELIPLELAIYYGHTETTGALVALADTGILERALMHAIKVEQNNAVDVILSRLTDTGILERALMHAIKVEQNNAVGLILSRLTDTGVVERGLMLAIRMEHNQAVNLILSRRAGPRAAGQIGPLEPHDTLSRDVLIAAAVVAARVGNGPTVVALAKHGVDLNAGSPFPPICGAIEGDHIRTLQTILESGGQANPSARCADGLSPLDLAARLGRRHVIRVLRAAGGQ